MNNTILNSYSGIKTHQFGLDSISNNIANVNTTGYRENLPEFKTLLSQHVDSTNANTVSSDSNMGVTAASNAISTKSGNYKPSEGDFDMAYAGKGWFVVGKNQQGSMTINEDGYEANQPNFFTRDGSFGRDAEGYIVNSSGYYLYGIDLGKVQGNSFDGSNTEEENTKALSANKLTPIRIPQDLNYQPIQTKKLDIALNLNPSKFPVPLGDFLLQDGKLDEENLNNLDLNALFNNEKEPLNAKVNNDIRIKITTPPTQGQEGAEASENEGETKAPETKEITLKYGNGGAEQNQFKTFKELQDLIKAQTGLELNILKDANGKPSTPLALELQNTGGDMRLSLEGSFFDKLGIKASDLEMKPQDKQVSNPLYVSGYTSNTEVYDKDGNKFLAQTQFFLQKTGGDGENQKWVSRSAIFDKDGKEQVSKEAIESSIEFDKDNKPITKPIDLEFGEGKIAYSFGGAKDKLTTNYNYQDSEVLANDTDGKGAGKLNDLRIDENGIIRLYFDNGESAPMGRVGIAAFTNDQGLRKTGGNMFEITQAINNEGDNKMLSGAPILGWGEENQAQLKFGKVMHKYLESSNTDITHALTNLILMQRGYSMNAKAFGTGDDLIKEAINLKK